MKKFNLTVIACIIATFVLSMIAFQPTTTEASNNVSPNPTPSPRKVKKMPVPVQSPITERKPGTRASASGMAKGIRKPKSKDFLGDFGTHEVGHKQRKTRKN